MKCPTVTLYEGSLSTECASICKDVEPVVNSFLQKSGERAF